MNRKLTTFLTIIFLGMLFPFNAAINNPERITFFNSAITINQDASMLVQENITVISKGQIIKRGVYRDFPTQYQDRYGNYYHVSFTLKHALLNGKPVSYEVKNLANGKRIYLGDKNTILAPGIYTFTIMYSTSKQLGFFEKHDELYWNVTGNGWIFAIEQATCTITLPQAISPKDITIDGYTGYQGEQAKAYQVVSKQPGSITIETTQQLLPKQGFTIAITWPKGIITAPSEIQNVKDFIFDNLYFIICMLLLIIAFIFYLIITIKQKIARKNYPVIPLFYPPHNFSPAQVLYLKKMGYTYLALTAEIVHMACNGLLTIAYQAGGMISSASYTLTRKTENNSTNLLHRALISLLFPHATTLLLQKNTHTMKAANNYLESTLQNTLSSNYFDDKHTYPILGAIALSLFGGLFLYTNETQLIFFIIATIAGHVPFYFLLKSYTNEGHKIMADIKGFELFLTTTELERMKIIGTPPTKTPELYEQYLPYAIALGVEKQWACQFGPMFEQMEATGSPYIPLWYTGYALSSFRADRFSKDLSKNFGSMVIAAASTPPSSSSGSGGRGSSGGGGGGGGGGGW